ncbi:MAG: Rieske 2Fe-2S domain-containing protein [Immundisolibacteraceae bacterium]|nr:Rieske 2Fe-2S domain-containing protein [Immundisolibacteraceae bacterium]
MTAHPDPRDFKALIDDRPDEGVFRVHRDVYLDQQLFELEMARVFEATWVFIGLTSEVEQPHDFITRNIGRQPVLITKDEQGEIRGFLNSCRHRGTLLCPRASGNKKFHACAYHGWTYSSSGAMVNLTDQQTGQYPEDFNQQNHDLVPIPRLESYRGFLFGSLSVQVPSLSDHLGGAKALIDLVADQAPDGLEFVSGGSRYTFDGNWKLQFENGLDAYHFASTHASFVDIVRQRPPRDVPEHIQQFSTDDHRIVAGTVSFDRGHAMSWSKGAPGQDPAGRPLPYDQQNFERVRDAVGEDRLSWMLRQRNLTIFPNLQIIDIQSLQVRTWEPLAADKTRMVSHCLAPKGESPEGRRFRIRQYEEFFNTGGLASSDDNVMYELSQAGLSATLAGTPQGFSRGMAAEPADSSSYSGLSLTAARKTANEAGLGFGDETGIHAGYREWLRLMEAGE